MSILDEIENLRSRYIEQSFDDAYLPNRLEIPEKRLPEFTAAIEMPTMFHHPITDGKIEYVPKNIPPEARTGDWNPLQYKGMDVTVGSKLQVWRMEKS